MNPELEEYKFHSHLGISYYMANHKDNDTSLVEKNSNVFPMILP